MNKHNFSDVTIVIKTFIRYWVCRKTIEAFQSLCPSIPIIVVDDTPLELRKKLNINGVNQVEMDPDSGLCAGRNLGFKSAKTEIILYTDDDAFPQMSSEELMECVELIRDGTAELVGHKGFRMEKTKRNLHLFKQRVSEPMRVDLTENAYIARRSMLIENPYDERIKINGEHFSWFSGLKENNVKVFTTPAMKFHNRRCSRNPEYAKFRNRQKFRKFARLLTGHRDAVWHSTDPRQTEIE